MGEIKFLAWERNLKEIIPVHNIDFVNRMINTGSAWRLFDEIELMQYTGLRDKNGIDGYHGYIYRNLDNGLIGKLQVLDGVGGLYVLCTEYKDGRIYNNLPFAEHDTTNFEFIGNIYENPGLIGGDF